MTPDKHRPQAEDYQLHSRFPRRHFILRGACRFRYFPLAGIPARERRMALKLRIAEWSPISDPRLEIILQGDHALVWAYPDPPEHANAPRATVETRLYPQPTESECTRLLACHIGYEGQAWKENRLIAAHWWEQLPDRQNWNHFLRASSLPPTQTPPPAQTLPRAKKPWGRTLSLDTETSLPSETWIWRIGLLLLCAVAAWEITRWGQLQGLIETSRLRQTELTAAADQLIVARQSALANQTAASNLKAIRPAQTQLELLDHLTDRFPKPQNIQLLNWSYRPDQLEFTITGRNLDPTRLVRAVEQLPWAENVTGELEGGGERMRMRLALPDTTRD